MHVTVPEPFTAISNGELHRHQPDRRAGLPHLPLEPDLAPRRLPLSVVAGEYAEIVEEWDGIPVQYYVPLGREEDGREVFKNTPDMLRFFSERTGVRYPYPKYSQVVVQDFIFGGMENVSATTLTENCLYDARAREDVDADALIAHEAAHQWFGDLLTCRDWSQGWLNEGFATFMELAYNEQNKGRDEFLYILARRDGQLPRRGGALPPPHRHQRLQRAHRPLRPPPLREGRHRPQHAARDPGRGARSGRRFGVMSSAAAAPASSRWTSSAPSKKRPAATSTGSSTSGSSAPAIRSMKGSYAWDDESEDGEALLHAVAEGRGRPRGLPPAPARRLPPRERRDDEHEGRDHGEGAELLLPPRLQSRASSASTPRS